MEFHRDIAIAAPPNRVWAVYLDVERWPGWTASVTSVAALTPGPLRVGHRVRIKQPRLPTTVWTVTELVEGRSWTWVAKGPGSCTAATHVVEPHAGGARAALSLTQAGPIGLLVGKLTSALTDRYLAMEAEGLKARAEAP